MPRHLRQLFFLFAKKIDRKPAAFERSTNFFSLRKKVAKKAKTLQVYRFVSAWESMKERASPRRDVYFVPRKHSAEPRGVRTLHEFFMVCKTACTKIIAIRRGGACSSRKFA
jgi:hypothetical protein